MTIKIWYFFQNLILAYRLCKEIIDRLRPVRYIPDNQLQRDMFLFSIVCHFRKFDCKETQRSIGTIHLVVLQKQNERSCSND